jgi:alpha-tubulin suppressor-like RCC1 family protein
MNINKFLVFNNLSKKFIPKIKFFYICSLNGESVKIITKCDKVFAYGSNTNGCLGLGHNNAVIKPQVVNELRDKQIIDISYGYNDVLVLTQSGQCYSCGYNGYGQLGNGTNSQCNRFWRIIGLNDKHVIGMSCGDYHSLVLLQSG